MAHDQWEKIEKVLDSVLDTEPYQWEAILDRTCTGNKELRHQVEKYLRHYTHLETFLQKPLDDRLINRISDDESFNTDWIEAFNRIGRYRIVREIAHGGMGRVFLAERADGEYTQRVALKLLHSGMDSETMQRRFRIERQILASLSHPNIARLFDGGVIESESVWGTRLPYLVMEYFEGSSIREYCEKKNLSVNERLQLFLKAAEAVQHAHRNLVVHCDIKPSNILVNDEGDLKLVDFGISRLMSGEGESGTGPLTRTTTHHWRTPEYAAPEQIKGERATIAVDVYQLGVLLYELLTGELPFKGTEKSIRELERRILETDPVKPSLAVQSEQLRKMFRGDLDAIILKALRKEPETRYPSMESFIDDINRYLNNLPVQARRGTLRYRSVKFFRRHKGAAVAAALFAALLTGYIITVTIYAERVSGALEMAQLETSKATQLSDFMVNLFETADPYRRTGEEPTIREFLDRAVQRIDDELADEPVVQAQLLMTLGQSYANLGLFDEAEPLLTRALDIHAQEFGNDHSETAASMTRLGRLIYRRGDFEAARSLYETALEIQERTLGPEHLEIVATTSVLGNLYKRIGELSVSREYLERSLDLVGKNLGTEHTRYATTLNDYALLLIIQGEHVSARDSLLRVVSILERELGPDHLLVGEALGNLSDVQGALGEHEERVRNASRYLEIAERELGTSHQTVANALINIGMAYRSLSRYTDAIPLFERAAEIYHETSGPRHHFVAYPLAHLGHTYRDMGDNHRAIDYYTQAAAIAEENQTLPHLAGILTARARVKMRMDDPAAALPDLERTLAVYRQVHPENHWRIAWSRNNLGECLTRLRRYDEALPHLNESYEILRDHFGMEHRNTQTAIRNLIAFYEAQQFTEQAGHYRALLAQSTP
jgi:eukaryotic-like serine/threonine-protein kinase